MVCLRVSNDWVNLMMGCDRLAIDVARLAQAPDIGMAACFRRGVMCMEVTK
jgi:hypothetical protein